ncbi:MAG: tetratricopeptide repeat protein [Planctomycetaceae bacterium]|jgi:tetratricopeptide (TPR) repeat protein|nr:tetratricopeptide repeat protein [Planctomycetaceae bacterium]
MKQILFATAILSITLFGTLSAQEADHSDEGDEADIVSTIVDTDNPGMGLLDRATEMKLRASTPMDLSQVISLCQRAKKMGLIGENLKYCDQLLASTQISRGLFFAEALEQPGAITGDWKELRRRALLDLEEGVTVIKDQPLPYWRIAQLQLLPDGNEERAKEALRLAVQYANNDPEIQYQAVARLAELEPEAEKREAVLATAAKSGNPRIVLLHAGALFELKRNDEALNVLRKLIEDESGNTKLHELIVAILAGAREYEAVMNILDLLREKRTDEKERYRVDLIRTGIFAKMKRYEEALKLLQTLQEQFREDEELSLETLRIRVDIHRAMDTLDEAFKDIEAAEKTNPDSLSILEIKCDLLVEQEKYDDALAVVKKLRSLVDRPPYMLREISILAEQKKFDDALEIAQQLQEKFPEGKSQWTMVFVDIYSKQKRYDKALALVEEQLNKEPEMLPWIAAKHQIFTAQKKWDDAVQWLESCLQMEPDSKVLHLLLIETMLLGKKQLKEAKERIRTLLEKEPEDDVLLSMDSQVSISLGLHSEAIEVLMKLIELAPEDYTSVNNLAWILCTSPIDSVRDGRRAVELAEKAAELSQHKRAFVLSTLAAAYAEVGDFEKAREVSQKSIETAKKEKGKTEEEQTELLENLRNELKCYEQDMPFRELMEEQ